jgi:transcriptional regulator with XRE-family HTH domain
MDINQLFILNLKKWRKMTKFSQKELAEKCGTSHSYIRQLESNKGHPSFALIGKIADALQIEPYQLFYDGTGKSGQTAYIKRMKAIQSELLKTVSGDIEAAFIEIAKD